MYQNQLLTHEKLKIRSEGGTCLSRLQVLLSPLCMIMCSAELVAESRENHFIYIFFTFTPTET